MIKDKQLISRLNRILPEWRTNDGECCYSDTVRQCARIAALKNLNLLYELVFEGNVNSRSRLSHRATSDIWALVIFLDNCLDVAIRDRELQATG